MKTGEKHLDVTHAVSVAGQAGVHGVSIDETSTHPLIA
jgi:hypothetical protein